MLELLKDLKYRGLKLDLVLLFYLLGFLLLGGDFESVRHFFCL